MTDGLFHVRATVEHFVIQDSRRQKTKNAQEILIFRWFSITTTTTPTTTKISTGLSAEHCRADGDDPVPRAQDEANKHHNASAHPTTTPSTNTHRHTSKICAHLYGQVDVRATSTAHDLDAVGKAAKRSVRPAVTRQRRGQGDGANVKAGSRGKRESERGSLFYRRQKGDGGRKAGQVGRDRGGGYGCARSFTAAWVL